MGNLRNFLKELKKRDELKHNIPDRTDRLQDVLGTILVKHRLGYGLSPQLTTDESIQILAIFDEGKEAYRARMESG